VKKEETAKNLVIYSNFEEYQLEMKN